MQDIYIGVDGGATRLTLRMENAAGELLGSGRGGSANIRLSVDATWHALRTALQTALDAAGLRLEDKNLRFHMGLGLAGCEVKEAVTAFLAYTHDFASLRLITDAHAACLGAHAGAEGAIIIAGTGSLGFQVQKGKTLQVGGWGFPQDDDGSGAWLGLQAARLTFHWLDGRANASRLVESVFDFFNADVEKFATWANRANSSEFARLAPLVIRQAEDNQSDAVQLMQQAAAAIDLLGVVLHKHQLAEGYVLPCSLAGGIAEFLLPWLSEDLRARLVPAKADACAGALWLIRQHVALERNKAW